MTGDGDAKGLNRRHVLGGLAAAGTMGLGLSPAAAGRTLPALGVQLYTLRNVYFDDPVGTLTKVAEIGYTQVEFAGFGDLPPGELAKVLADLGLEPVSAHLAYEDFLADPVKAVESAKAVGCKYATFGWIPPNRRTSKADWLAIAATINKAGKAANAAGLKCAYHNHDFEFRPVEGIVPYHVILTRTDPDLVALELDFYWAAKGNQDVLRLFRERQGRFELCHVKDMGKDGNFADVGAGTLDFASYFKLIDTAGLKYFLVERDDAPDPYFASIKASYDYLKALEF